MVAGMNYKLKVAVKAGDATQVYSAVVYGARFFVKHCVHKVTQHLAEKLPAYGGVMELTHYEKVDDAVRCT